MDKKAYYKLEEKLNSKPTKKELNDYKELNPWKFNNKKTIHNHLHIVEEHNLTNADDYNFTMPVIKPNNNSVIICPLSITDNNLEVTLIKQYRYSVNDYTLELPAGGIDDDNSLTAAKKELLEEAGLISYKWIFLTKQYTMPNLSDHQNYYLLALDCIKISNNTDCQPIKVDFKEAINFKNITAPSLLTLLLAKEKINNFKIN